MSPYFLRLVASCTATNMECPEFFVIGRFLGISSTLLLLTFFILVACKLDGEIGSTAWGVVFIPIWFLQFLHFVVGLRYLNPNYDTMPADQLPDGYRTIRSGRRFGLALLWMMVLAFNIMLVVQLTELDNFDLVKQVRDLSVREFVDEVECRTQESNCDAVNKPRDFRSILECGYELKGSGIFHIPVHILFIPIYAFLSLVLLALIIPPDFYGYFYLDAFLPVVLAGYYSPPPRFGLPTQMYAEIRIPTKPAEEEVTPEQGAFPDKYPTERHGSPHNSDDEEEGRVSISIQSDREYLGHAQPTVHTLRMHNYEDPPEQDTENEQELAQKPNTSSSAQDDMNIDDAIMK